MHVKTAAGTGTPIEKIRPSWMPVRGRLWLLLSGVTDQVQLRICGGGRAAS